MPAALTMAEEIPDIGGVIVCISPTGAITVEAPVWRPALPTIVED